MSGRSLRSVHCKSQGMEKSLKRFPKERHPERLSPGDPEPETGLPGSIEQQLDMVEEGSLRGDELLHRHGVEPPGEDLAREGELLGVDQLMSRNAFELDMAEESREGSELSGDEHSRGLQGGDSELQSQPHLSSGLPGEQDRHERFFEAHAVELEFSDLLPEDAEPQEAVARHQAPGESPPRIRRKSTPSRPEAGRRTRSGKQTRSPRQRVSGTGKP